MVTGTAGTGMAGFWNWIRNHCLVKVSGFGGLIRCGTGITDGCAAIFGCSSNRISKEEA